MTKDRKLVEKAARRKFLLDDIHIQKNALDNGFTITVFKWRIGSAPFPSQVDKSKSYTYKATVERSGEHVSIVEE